MEYNDIPKISFDPAYSGGLLLLDRTQWALPVVFDIDGIEERIQIVPILRDHDQNLKVGQTDNINYDGGNITAEGRLLNLGIDAAAGEVFELWKRGSEMQASISTGLIDPRDVELVEEGRQVYVNGQTFTGPIEVVRKWKLKEISVVTLGADDTGTQVRIGEAMRPRAGAFFAPRGKESPPDIQGGFENMYKEEKRYKIARALFGRRGKAEESVEEDVKTEKKEEIVANALRAYAEEMEVKEEDLTDEERKTLLAAFAAIDGMIEEKKDGEARRASAAEETEEKILDKREEIVEEKTDDREEIDAEDILRQYAESRGIRRDELTEEEIEIVMTTAKILKPEKTVDAACDDDTRRASARSGAAAWSRTKFPADVIGRYGATITGSRGLRRPNAARVAEASLLTCHGTSGDALKACGYNDEEIDEANRAENRNLSLLGLMFRAGVASYGDRSVDTIASGLKRAQFQSMLTNTTGYRQAHAAGELSTVDIPNVLANVMHKSLILGLMTVDDPTERLSRVVNAVDFRDQYFVNLLTSGEFADVKPNGELENLKLTDTGYTNRAKMRGFELRLGYEAIANDDMNAVAEIPRIMGRKAGLRKQKIFFETLTSIADITAITGNPALNLAGLDKGLAAFRGIKDGDGDPLGLRPKFLLVPPALEQTALSFVTARDIVQGDTGSPTGLAIVPNASRYSGRFEAVTSEYLGSGSPFSSAWGDKKWMLLADPYDVPLLILSYYQNQRQPTLRTVYGEVEVEGLKFKCWWGFGVSVAEKKGAVVSSPS